VATNVSNGGTNTLGLGARKVVRSSSGAIYILFVADVIGIFTIRIFKSNDGGASFAIQDEGGAPGDADLRAPSMAIDSVDIIHISYFFEDGKDSSVRRVLFHTVDAASTPDTFQGDEQVLLADTEIGGFYTAITIDSSDIPHLLFVDASSNMGTDFDTVNYTNRIGGTWKTAVQIEGFTAERQCRRPDITISDENVPEVTYGNESENDVGTALGNQNDATSFELFDIDTAASDGIADRSIAIDSSGNTWVAWNSFGDDLELRQHLDADPWSTWQTIINLDAVNNLRAPSLAIDGGDTYVLTEDQGDDDIYEYKNQDARISLEVGIFQDVKVKWSHLNNNGGATQIDYVFFDGTDIFWNEIVLAAVFNPYKDYYQRHNSLIRM